MELYPLLLALHNLTRWLVLLAGLLSLWVLFRSLPTARVYASSYVHAYSSSWASSSFGKAPAYRNLALARENPEVGFFLFEHWVGIFGLGPRPYGPGPGGEVLAEGFWLTLASLLLTLFSTPWWRPWIRL